MIVWQKIHHKVLFVNNKDFDFFSHSFEFLGPECYSSNQFLTLVATTNVCANISSVVKGPSSRMIFVNDSVEYRCSNVEMSLVRSSFFSATKSAPAVSFVFANEIPQGVVVNSNRATIGQLMGDGSILSFDEVERIVHFRACLLIQNATVTYPSYTVKDFGYTTANYDYIYPLNFNVTVEVLENVLVFWCVNVNRSLVPSSDGVIRLFPILRMEKYQSVPKEYYDDQTVDLVHTLGACYCFDLVLFLVFMIVMLNSVRKTKKEIPIVAWIALIFCILCIFRIVFCFLWPDGGFENNPVAQYAVFEIPTFLLFSVVIIAIAFWRKLSRKRYLFQFLCDLQIFELSWTSLCSCRSFILFLSQCIFLPRN